MTSRWILLFLACTAGALSVRTPPVRAQSEEPDRTVVTAAGSQYRAGFFHRWILGRHYRDLWTTPIEVEVLDLATYAGGLRPLRTGGGMQTRSLRFMGADGREYAFRSVDKDPSAVIDSILRETFIDDLVQDGISAAHPYGALVAPPLLEAAGVLHVVPRLMVMPDDPALGPFREEFAGMLGMIEERPDENEGERGSFRGTRRVIASETLVERLARGPDDRVDERAFLRARLVDVFLGDWDRHREQWRWATYDEEEPRRWLPVPTDRDQAFSKFDGLATRIVGLYMPQFVRFEEDYPSLTRLHWNARELDRWFLSGLDRAAWDSVGHDLVEQLDDEVIARAVAQLPPEIHALNGEELRSALIARRAKLPEAWASFYRLLARRVDVRLTDAPDVVSVERVADGEVRVVAAAEDGEPWFERTFLGSETEEIRLYLGGGDDLVSLSGGGAEGGTFVRAIGGPGDDTYDFRDPDERVALYDSDGDDEAQGQDPPAIDRKRFEEWVWTEEDRDQPRDWGRRTLPIFWSSYGTDIGLFIGGGVQLQSYGFRTYPYARRIDIRGGVAPLIGKSRLEIDGRANSENSPFFATFGARVSRLDVIHYYGLGNDAPRAADDDYHRVDQTVTAARFGLGVSPGPGWDLSAEVAVERMSTQDDPATYFGSLGPVYGGGSFVQASAVARLRADPLAGSDRTGHRVRLDVGAELFPPLFDAESAFGRIAAEVSALLVSSPSPRLSLALRASAEDVWGRVPWYEAAFLGGVGSLAAWEEQRFAGDVALSGSAELLLRVWQPGIIVPVSLGVFGLADGGRVYLDGASPGGWHTSIGGGVWLRPVLQPYIVRAGVASGAEATKVFVTLGLPY